MKEVGLIDAGYVNTVIRKRPSDIHKGDCGRVLIIAGSFGMAGAAILCSKAALRAGSGLVRIAAPREIIPILQTGVPEATCIMREASQIKLEDYSAVAFGPGLGDDKKDVELLTWILSKYDKTLVIDADGLNLIGREKLYEEVKKTKAQVIITPHIVEAKRLLAQGQSPLTNTSRLTMLQSLVEATEATVVLKGHRTIVADNLEEAYTNTTGNPGMATGGSGDVLTGVIASLAGQGLKPLDAAKAGVYIHGLAGDIMAEEMGEYGLLAGDIPKGVALALKRIIE